jgi:hypothetical protein
MVGSRIDVFVQPSRDRIDSAGEEHAMFFARVPNTSRLDRVNSLR